MKVPLSALCIALEKAPEPSGGFFALLDKQNTAAYSVETASSDLGNLVDH